MRATTRARTLDFFALVDAVHLDAAGKIDNHRVSFDVAAIYA